MTQTNTERERLLSQRTFGPLHQFRKFGDRGASFGMGFEQLHILFRILFALGNRFLHHFCPLDVNYKGRVVAQRNRLSSERV
jgi:hypothetical protein